MAAQNENGPDPVFEALSWSRLAHVVAPAGRREENA
jgi:hypothetical protein